eukprot:TRINITY_DN52563_c0_g1_i1.p1 TRINITY_DN52563_c0_g1~~TRINITY_DN52563_c0_g1_i1.p1  ORF type:complete len:417 (-),score=80.27 TRINITY_DN52563_c0_g1_i1:85-1281(-)
MAPIEEDTVSRPASHFGLGNTLPPLQPCADARTPLEALKTPAATTTRDGSVAVVPADGANAALIAGKSETGDDILSRLRQLEISEAKALSVGASPERHWGEAETRARQAMETYSESDGDERNEASKLCVDALEMSSPQAIDSDGFALLHYAAMYGCVEGMAVLLRRKGNINARTKVHETPLQLAAYYRHAEICALLLAHKARVDLADWQGRTPLSAAKESKCGNGLDNHGQAQARCVALLASRVDQEAAWRRGEAASAAEQADVVSAVAAAARGAAELRQQGSDFFGKGQYKEAVAAYSLALSSFDDAVLYSNRAECYLKLQSFLKAKMDARKAVGLFGEAGNKKAVWRLGRACLALDEVSEAADSARDGLRLWPGDPALKQLATDAERARRRRLRGE